MTAKRVLGTAAALALSAAVCAGSYGAKAGAGTSGKGGLPQGSEPVTLDPADFTTRIDNPWWPMRVGTRWIYRETAPDGTRQRVVVTVTGRKKRIANGVTARVVHDVVTEKGKPVEVTDDWYAQDKAGNIWYFGELTKEFENGKFRDTQGSFEAGVDGAQAGVIMPARPRPGLRYRQEYYKGEAEDKGAIVSLREQAEVPFGHFGRGRVLMTKDTNPLEPKVLEFKFYARGVGPVLAVGVSGGADREELVRFTR
ncbi:MAG: hypothetical protein AABM31_00520 [Actinomycetota bacterium]